MELSLSNRQPFRAQKQKMTKQQIRSSAYDLHMPNNRPPADGELPGLLAHRLNVGARADQRYPDRPQWVEVEGARADVDTIESEWREEDRLGFLVTLTDGRRMLLYYVPNEDFWSGVVMV
jgi:hypothetical protein